MRCPKRGAENMTFKLPESDQFRFAKFLYVNQMVCLQALDLGIGQGNEYLVSVKQTLITDDPVVKRTTRNKCRSLQ